MKWYFEESHYVEGGSARRRYTLSAESLGFPKPHIQQTLYPAISSMEAHVVFDDLHQVLLGVCKAFISNISKLTRLQFDLVPATNSRKRDRDDDEPLANEEVALCDGLLAVLHAAEQRIDAGFPQQDVASESTASLRSQRS